MNTKAKGRKAEKEYAQILIDRGYMVEIVKPSNKFGSVDFFGIADIIALHSTGIYLIQVKSNSTAGAIKKMTQWYNSNLIYLPKNIHLNVVVRMDGKAKEKPHWKIKTII